MKPLSKDERWLVADRVDFWRLRTDSPIMPYKAINMSERDNQLQHLIYWILTPIPSE